MYKLDHFLKLLREKKPFAYVSIADGEMGAILKGEGYTTSKKYQVITKELRDRLEEALLYRQDNYYVGICCDQWRASGKEKEMVGEYENLTYAWVFQMINWHKALQGFINIFKDKKTVWVGGQDQDVNKLPFKVSLQIGVPNTEAWDINDRVSRLAFNDGDIVLVSAGCNSVPWIHYWFKKYKKTTFIDIGCMFDPMTRGIWRRFQLDPKRYCRGCKNHECE